jgi:serine phosphatase RsbU (regulator of sigma subunit)
MFGAERLQSILRTARAQGVDAILQHVEETVRTFRGRTEPLDDATLMALRLQA